MSRSYKKHPVHPIAISDSEKDDKKIWHSCFRSKSKQYIKNKLVFNDDWDFPIHFRKVSNVWCFDKDGKCWFYPLTWKRGKTMFKKDIKTLSKYLYTQKYLHHLFGK